MTDQEIIDKDIAKNHPEYSHAQAMLALHHEMKNPNGGKHRFGNTIFIVRKEPNNSIEFHTINADKSSDLLNNTKQFLNFSKLHGIKTAHTNFNSAKVSELFKHVGFPVSIDNTLVDGKIEYTAKVSL